MPDLLIFTGPDTANTALFRVQKIKRPSNLVFMSIDFIIRYIDDNTYI